MRDPGAQVQPIILSCKTLVQKRVQAVKTANTKFSFYADDSWVDMQVRKLHLDSALDDELIHELLAALLEDYKRYRPLWKTEEEFRNFLNEHVDASKREYLIEKAGLPPHTQQFSEKFEAKLSLRAGSNGSSKLGRPVLVEYPALPPQLRLSIGIANSPPANPATLEGALYNHFHPFLEVTIKALRSYQKLVPVAYVFCHRSSSITPEDAIRDLVETLDGLQPITPSTDMTPTGGMVESKQ